MKNQGHQAWKGLVPLKDPTGALLREQLGYVDGYMLMADDLFREISKIEQEKNWTAETREMIRRLRRVMHALRGSAKATEKLLLRAGEEHEHERQAVAAAELGEGLRPDLGGVPGQPALQGAAPAGTVEDPSELEADRGGGE
jgi:hypothetical protein